MFFKEHQNIVLLFAGVLGLSPAVLRPPALSEAPLNVLVPAKGQADRAAAWEHGAAGTRAPGGGLTYTLGEVPAPHLVHLAAYRRACSFHKLRFFSSTLPRRAPASAHGAADTSPPRGRLA